MVIVLTVDRKKTQINGGGKNTFSLIMLIIYLVYMRVKNKAVNDDYQVTQAVNEDCCYNCTTAAWY